MKFNLNHKELLALYDLLQVTLNAAPCRTIDDVQLRQVHNRLKACIFAALDSDDRRGSVLLNDVFSSSPPPAPRDESTVGSNDIMTDDDDEVLTAAAYPLPRKGGPPLPHMPRPNKHRKNKH